MAKPITTTDYAGTITSIGDYPRISIVWGAPEKPPTKSAVVKPDNGSKDVIFDIGFNEGPADLGTDAIASTAPFPISESDDSDFMTQSNLESDGVEIVIHRWPSLRSNYFKVGDRVSFTVTDGPLGPMPSLLRKV